MVRSPLFLTRFFLGPVEISIHAPCAMYVLKQRGKTQFCVLSESSANRRLLNFAAASNSADSFRPPPPFGSVPEYSSTPPRRRRRLGCNVDVCNETIAKKALTSGSFSGLRQGLTASVFTTRKLSTQSSNTLMKMLR